MCIASKGCLDDVWVFKKLDENVENTDPMLVVELRLFVLVISFRREISCRLGLFMKSNLNCKKGFASSSELLTSELSDYINVSMNFSTRNRNFTTPRDYFIIPSSPIPNPLDHSSSTIQYNPTIRSYLTEK